MTERIATSVTAIREAVQQKLAFDHPELNNCLGQVSSAMRMFEQAWTPSTAEEILAAYESALGGRVPKPVGDAAVTQTGMLLKFLIKEWSAGLAEGMDIQLARGWNPEVAWQRSLAGFGLNAREMRGYIASVIRPTDSAADAVVTSSAKKRAASLTSKSDMKIAEAEITAIGKAAATIKASLAPEPTVAGLAVHAADTGRVLMLQRALDPKDPAGGTWEFPGGHIDPEDKSPLHTAVREWREEVGRRAPAGKFVGSWDHGNYRGHVVTVDHEKDVPIGNGRGTITNPDDPDGDQIEQLAWWSPEQLSQNPAVRSELRASMKKVRGVIPSTIAKVFNPNERRDSDGRWSRTSGGESKPAAPPRTATRVRRAPDAVDIALQESNIAEERGNSLGNPQKNPLAAPQSNPFGAPQRDPFQSPQSDPFASPQRDAFLHPDSPLVPEKGKKRRRDRILIIVAPGPTSEKEPGEVPPEPEHLANLFMPSTDIGRYFDDHSKSGAADFTSSRSADDEYSGESARPGGALNFSSVSTYYAQALNIPDIKPRAFTGGSPWEFASGAEVDEDEWQDAVDIAEPMWKIVNEDPVDYANQLGPSQVGEIAEMAGYRGGISVSAFKSMLADDVGRRDNGGSPDSSDPAKRFDPSLINALADYVVWREPTIVPGGDRLDALLEDSSTLRHLDEEPVTNVMSFTTLAKGDTPRHLKGRYFNSFTAYHSALDDNGVNAEPGVIGIQESMMLPSHPWPGSEEEDEE